MKKFNVGDKVYDLRFGNGEVIEVMPSRYYPLTVKFEGTQNRTYMADGKYTDSSVNPTLYHGHDLVVTVSEPVYEYQILSFHADDDMFVLSSDYYTTVDKYIEVVGIGAATRELFLPSKRLRK